MVSLGNKHHKPSSLATRLSLVALVVLIAWLGLAVGKEAYRKQHVADEINRVRQEIASIEERNYDLAALIESFKDPQVVEREAKRRLNLKRPGEEVVVILRDKSEEYNIVRDTPEASKPRAAIFEQESGNLANLLKWWQYITGQ